MRPPSLTALVRQLHRPRAPSLAALIRKLHGSGDYRNFEELVRNLLPGHAEAILRIPQVDDQLHQFFARFEQEFFPLYGDWLDMVEDEDDPVGQVVDFGMPLQLEGFTDEELHELQALWDPPRLLLACLGDISGRFYGEGDEGVRVTWLEALDGKVDRALLKRIPDGGWPAKRLAALLHETEYAGAALLVEWINCVTGCFFLDANYDDGYENPAWTVNRAVAGRMQWQGLQAILVRVNQMVSWLEEDMNGHFAQLLDFIERREREVPQDQAPVEPRFLVEIFRPEDVEDD